MKVYIQYIFFSGDKLYHFIKNSSNNENWPKASKYLEILTGEFGNIIKEQKKVVDDYREYLKNKQRKGDDSFLIRVKNEINNKMKILRDPEFKELEPKIRKRELENLKMGADIYERFFRFDGSWADVKKIEGTDLILTCGKLRQWNDERDYPIAEVNNILDEWELDIAKTNDEFPQLEDLRSYEIEVLERTKDTITFIWRIPKDKDNNIIIFPNIKNYLFFFYGEFFEVSDWEQTNLNTVEVIAEISIFYNYYWNVIKSSANGILHHSPLAKEEICSCAEYDIATNYYNFGSTYKLKMGLYKLDKSVMSIASYVETRELPLIQTGTISPINDPEKEINGSSWGNMWNTLWDGAVGTVYFNLSKRLENYAYVEKWFHVPQAGINYSNSDSVEIGWKKIIGKSGEPEGDDINEILKTFDLDKPIMYHFLRNHIKATLFWRQKQIWQGNYWLLNNSFQIWETVNSSGTTVNIFGNNLMIGKVTENITTKIGGNAFVSKFLEVIVDTTLNDSKDTQNRQIERSVTSEGTSGGKAFKKESNTKTTTKTRDLSKGDNKPSIGSSLLKPHLYGADHVKAEYTAFQFLHRWVLSGVYPIMMRIEFSQLLLNQYRNRKELKGKPTYDYFNALTFGDILNVSGYLQASIISWDNVPYADWFREKIESGVYIYDNDPKEFYKRKIKSPLNIASSGGTTRGGFNIVTLGTKLKGGIGRDDAVNVDGMSWVWKSTHHRPSYCRPEDGSGRDIFPDIMNQMKHNIKEQDMYAWKFRGEATGTGTLIIPKGIKYDWSLQGYSKGASDKCNFTGLDDDGKISVHQRGAEWELEFIGNFKVERKIGTPEGVPPQTDPDVSPTDPFDKAPEPMAGAIPSPIPEAGTPDPFGGGLGGDPEMEMPDPEQEKEKEPEAPEQEPEPEPEPEPEGEPEPEKADEEQEREHP